MSENLKDKINEVKGAASEIASDENKQRLTDAKNEAIEKAKKFKCNKKNIAIIAVVIVAIIAAISLLGGGGPDKRIVKEAEEVVHQSTGYDAKDLKFECRYEVPESERYFKEEEIYYFIGKLEGKGEHAGGEYDGQYFLCQVERTSDGSEENLHAKYLGAYPEKSQIKEILSEIS